MQLWVHPPRGISMAVTKRALETQSQQDTENRAHVVSRWDFQHANMSRNNFLSWCGFTAKGYVGRINEITTCCWVTISTRYIDLKGPISLLWNEWTDDCSPVRFLYPVLSISSPKCWFSLRCKGATCFSNQKTWHIHSATAKVGVQKWYHSGGATNRQITKLKSCWVNEQEKLISIVTNTSLKHKRAQRKGIKEGAGRVRAVL